MIELWRQREIAAGQAWLDAEMAHEAAERASADRPAQLEAARQTAYREGFGQGVADETARLSAVFKHPSISNSVERMETAMKVAAASPAMSARDVVSFVLEHLAASEIDVDAYEASRLGGGSRLAEHSPAWGGHPPAAGSATSAFAMPRPIAAGGNHGWADVAQAINHERSQR